MAELVLQIHEERKDFLKSAPEETSSHHTKTEFQVFRNKKWKKS
jgi:hypothetical protein